MTVFVSITLFLLNLEILEVLSLADGKVIPQGRIKYIQHLEGGIVDEILIKEGEKVDLKICLARELNLGLQHEKQEH